MPKINPNLLPAPVTPRVEEAKAAVPGQGDFVIYLRHPSFSEFLKIQEQVQQTTQSWEKQGNWYPSCPPVAPSETLWQIVVPALQLQVAADGSELPEEEKYTEAELTPIVGRMPAVYGALAAAITVLTLAVQGDLGNG